MTEYGLPLLGGVLIGLSATLLLAINGRIAGISGMLHSLVHPVPNQTYWRWFFLAGLLSASFLLKMVSYEAIEVPLPHPLWMIGLGGFIAGIGTRMSGGCTSGHGVCGLGRRSPRSIVATVLFMFSGMVTVYLVRIFAEPY